MEVVNGFNAGMRGMQYAQEGLQRNAETIARANGDEVLGSLTDTRARTALQAIRSSPWLMPCSSSMSRKRSAPIKPGRAAGPPHPR